MNTCAQITILNISEAAKNRLGSVAEAALDLPLGFSIRLTKDVVTLTDANKLNTEGAVALSVPKTPTNDALFIEYLTPSTLDNRKIEYDCRVVQSGYGLNFDRIRVNGHNIAQGVWELELLRRRDHWADLANAFEINNLDYGDFELTEDSVLQHWADHPGKYTGDYRNVAAEAPVWWPLVDYGGWCDASEPGPNEAGRFKCVLVEDLRPLLSVPYILQAGFCAIGWTLEGRILESEWVKRLWTYVLKPDYYKASEHGGRFIAKNYDEFEWLGGWSPYLICDSMIDAPTGWAVDGELFPPFPTAGQFKHAAIRNKTAGTLPFRFTLKMRVKNQSGAEIVVSMGVYEMTDTVPAGYTGEVISPANTEYTIPNGATVEVNFDETVYLKPFQAGGITCATLPTSGVFVQPGLYCEIQSASQSLMTDDAVEVAKCVHNYTLLDVFKGFLHLIRGKVDIDFETKTVTVFPNRAADVWGEHVSGFIRDEEASVDLEPKLIQFSAKQVPVRRGIKRYTRVRFQSTDAQDQTTEGLEPKYSRKVTNGLELPDGVDEFVNPFFSATPEGEPQGVQSGSAGRQPRPRLPQMYDNTDGSRSFDIQPRILYGYGPVRHINPHPINSINLNSSIFFNHIPDAGSVGLVLNVPYATQRATWDFSPTPTQRGTVVYGVEGDDLFTKFWLGISQEGKYAHFIEALVSLKMSDYTGLSFRDLYTFRFLGVPLRLELQEIRDFAACDGTPTPVRFLAPAQESECCDLPCGCRFIECEYYQDLGFSLQQETLDDMTLSSFKINGIEFAASPISFGKLKIVDVRGKQYVMNLVDALQSVGAPYFTISVSEREEGNNKGMRWFKIKRPICHTFSIQIKINADVAYEYTETAMKQYLFSGSTGFGYTNQHNAPIGCVTTTEY